MAGRMRVVFCWPEISGYMAACWQAMQLAGEVDVAIVSYEVVAGTFFKPHVMAGLEWHQLPERSQGSESYVRGLCSDLDPDVLVIPGWMNRAYRALPKRGAIGRVPVVMSMDTPWRGGLKQRIAKVALSAFLKRIDHVLVPGERAFQYARKLGFGEHQISTGLYGHDDRIFRAVFDGRSGWPRAFAFVGRYEEYKGLDVLIEAYLKYRECVDAPWTLHCCGAGSLGTLLAQKPGVRDLGFVQPDELPQIMSRVSAFVLPSRAESWGVALAEACSSGLPVIATNGVGATVELLRDGYNGAIAPGGDVNGMAEALLRIHKCAPQELREMGRRSIEFAAPFGARQWAKNFAHMLERFKNR